MDGRKRPDTTSRPAVESLEGRRLLSAGASARKNLRAAQAGSVVTADRDKQFAYRQPDGDRVTITLTGPGSLKGTRLSPAGRLILRFGGTTQDSGIVGRVKGRGDGRADLLSIADAGTSPYNQTGTGSPPIAYINLHRFDLVNTDRADVGNQTVDRVGPGTINLLGGIGAMFLGSAGRNTQIYMKQGPISPIINPITRQGLNITNDQGTGQIIIAPTATGTTLSTGTTLTGEVLVSPNQPTQATPQGIDFRISRVAGETGPVPRIQNPRIYAVTFDGSGHDLLQLEYKTGVEGQTTAPSLSIESVTDLGDLGGPTVNPEVGLGRVQGQLVAVVGAGTQVIIRDALNPSAEIGRFSAASLPGIVRINGVGSTAFETLLTYVDAAGETVTQPINLEQSVLSGAVVPNGAPSRNGGASSNPFDPGPKTGFFQQGGATGVVNSNAVLLGGVANFNTFLPDKVEYGLLGATVSSSLAAIDANDGVGSFTVTETARQQIKTPANVMFTMPMDPNMLTDAPQALGSIEQAVAINDFTTTAAGGANTVYLYDIRTGSLLTPTGVTVPGVTTPITGLSESFHPELAGAAVIDVQGNLRTFRADSIAGLGMNVNGNLYLVRSGEASDSTVIGRPIVHVDLPDRSDVNLISTDRPTVGTRGGVTIVPAMLLAPFGPLFTPNRVGLR